jgi:hypothetical protein
MIETIGTNSLPLNSKITEFNNSKTTSEDTECSSSSSSAVPESSVSSSINTLEDRKKFGLSPNLLSHVKDDALPLITKGVLRKKLSKMRHLVVQKLISPEYLDSLMPQIFEHFEPQKVMYNGGIANVKEWKISCYLEVMEGGVPCTNPSLPLLNICGDLLKVCDGVFLEWYRQQHTCNAGK